MFFELQNKGGGAEANWYMVYGHRQRRAQHSDVSDWMARARGCDEHCTLIVLYVGCSSLMLSGLYTCLHRESSQPLYNLKSLLKPLETNTTLTQNSYHAEPFT